MEDWEGGEPLMTVRNENIFTVLSFFHVLIVR